jgi:hypothetical protein
VTNMKSNALLAMAVTAGIVAAATVSPQLASADPTAPPTGHPCDWVTTDEAAGILGGPVSARPHGDDAGSLEMSCGYSRGLGEDGMTSELRLPGAFPDDAASQFALATASVGAVPVDDLGAKAVCVSEPTTTPPSTTLLVLLSGDRIYRATGWYSLSCATLTQFAQTAIGRIA